AIAPVDGRVHRLLSLRGRPRARGQDAEAIVEIGQQLSFRHHVEPRRSHLDGERQSIQARAYLVDRRGVLLHLEAGSDERCASVATSAAAPSLPAASSTHHPPSGPIPPACLATSAASRLLPAPPVPVSVTIRELRSSCLSERSSASRPTNVVR